LLRSSVADIVDLREVKLPGYILVALLRAAGGSITVAEGDGQLEDDEELIQYARSEPWAIVMKIRKIEVRKPDEVREDRYGRKRSIWHGEEPPMPRHAGMLWRDPERCTILEFKIDPAGWYFCPESKFDVYWRHPNGEKSSEHPDFEGPPTSFTPEMVATGQNPPIGRERVLWKDPDIKDREVILKYFRGNPTRPAGWYCRDPWLRYRDDMGKKALAHPLYSKD
jgi:hypothetical protein